MTRTQWILAGALLLQLGLIALVRSPFSTASASTEPRPLLPALDAGAAQRIELLGDEEKKVVLTRNGGAWHVDSLDGFPADGVKVDGLLKTLRELTAGRPVVTSSRYHDTFKVETDENEGRVRVWTSPDGEPAVDLIVGSSPNYQLAHVRKASEDPVYEIRGLATYDLQPEASSWATKDLVQVEPGQVVALEVTNRSGSFALEREAGGAWKIRSPAGAEGTLDAAKVDELVRAAASLRIADPVGREEAGSQGLDAPAATVVLRVAAAEKTTATEQTAGAEAAAETAAAPQEVTVRIGKPLEENTSQRYVTRDGFGYTGTVWESSVERLIEGELQGLLAS
jgi:hypothetical protein